MKKFKLVKNTIEYWEFIKDVRNSDRVREGFIDQNKISSKEQAEYMKKNGEFFWVCLEGIVPVGYVGIIENDIRVATHPDHHKKGVATFMISEIMKKYPEAFAKIKIENEASINLFKKCGFIKKYYIFERE